MIKIRKLEVMGHPILGDLTLDFCDANGKPVDTILIAGENGCGKSTVLEFLYSIVSGNLNTDAIVEIEKDDEEIQLTFYHRGSPGGSLWVKDSIEMDASYASSQYRNQYQMAGIFSDVEINFTSNNPNSVTSMVLDSENNSKKSNSNMPQLIKQLLIDIQASDDSDISRAIRDNPDSTYKSLDIHERIPRFTKAFNRMFESLTVIAKPEWHKTAML